MKNTLLPSILLLVSILSGCANYSASPLNSLSSQIILETSDIKNNDVIITAKIFNKSDCRKYLDRDVIKKGYQPIQIYIQNNSNKIYSFALDRISLPCARAKDVARKVHTSTAGRTAAYGVPALFLLPLAVLGAPAQSAAIPAVVEGVKSTQANKALDRDFSAKTAMDQTIFPHTHLNKIIFVPVNDYQETFKITLIDHDSTEARHFNVNSY